MAHERRLGRQLTEETGNDGLGAYLPLAVAAAALQPALEVGASAAGGDDRDRRDHSFITPGTRDRKLAAMPEPRELRREVDLALDQAAVQRVFVWEDAAKARWEARHAFEDRLDDAMVVEQIRFPGDTTFVPGRSERRHRRARHRGQAEVVPDRGVVRCDDRAKEHRHTSAPARRIVSTDERTTLSPR